MITMLAFSLCRGEKSIESQAQIMINELGKPFSLADDLLPMHEVIRLCIWVEPSLRVERNDDLPICAKSKA